MSKKSINFWCNGNYQVGYFKNR